MYPNDAITFDRIQSGLSLLLTHCEMEERRNKEKHANSATASPVDRLRWNLNHDVQCIIEREHMDALLSEWGEIAHGHALEMNGEAAPKPCTYDAVIEFVLRWARYCNRIIGEGFDRQTDMAEQMLWIARAKHCRSMLETLRIADRHYGLSDDDMRAVFEDRALRERNEKAKPARCDVLKLGGTYRARVFNGFGSPVEEHDTQATRKDEALTIAAGWLARKGIDVTPALVK